MAKRIPLTRGLYALVDDEDYERLSQSKWHAQKGWKEEFYAAHSTTRLRMHRIILNAADGVLVDHKNHNGLDNQKDNLRICDRSSNEGNSLKRHLYRGRPTRSKYKGVYIDRRSGKWAAGVMCRGIRYRRSDFVTEEAAAHWYDEKAMKLFGQFARVNFP